MDTKYVQVDLEVWKEIEKNRESFTQTPNDILRKIFMLTEASAKEKVVPAEGGSSETVIGLSTEYGLLPDGMKLSRVYKGKEYNAQVVNGAIELEGIRFNSLSMAGVHVTKYNVNGWHFWKYFDEKTQKWEPMVKKYHS